MFSSRFSYVFLEYSWFVSISSNDTNLSCSSLTSILTFPVSTALSISSTLTSKSIMSPITNWFLICTSAGIFSVVISPMLCLVSTASSILPCFATATVLIVYFVFDCN